MTTDPEVLRLAREIASKAKTAAKPEDIIAGHWDRSPIVRATIAAIEKTTELAITHLHKVYSLSHFGLQQFEHIERHLRQSEKDNSDAD